MLANCIVSLKADMRRYDTGKVVPWVSFVFLAHMCSLGVCFITFVIMCACVYTFMYIFDH